MAETHVSSTKTTAASLGGILHAVLRIGAGLLFMQHGAQKLFGLFGGNQVELISQMGLAGVLEFFGGLLIALGLFTRPVAIILVIEMLWAYFQAHLPRGAMPIQNGGELALLFALVFAYIAAHGPGPASLDRMMRAGRTATRPATTSSGTRSQTTAPKAESEVSPGTT